MLTQGSGLTKKRNLCCGLFLATFYDLRFRCRWAAVALAGYGKLSLYTKRRWVLLYNADIKIVSGCSKRPSSKAAGESKPEAYPLGYVEDFDELRTKLADFFSILLGFARGG